MKKVTNRRTSGIPAGATILHYDDRGKNAIRSLSSLLRGVPYENCPNHVSTYVGGGKGSIIEAIIPFVQESRLKKYMKKGERIEVIVYDLTQTKVEIVKAYLYGAIGKIYDIGAIPAFIIRILPRWLVRMLPIIREIRPGSWANFCSELDVEAHERAGVKISDYPASETMPVDIRVHALSVGISPRRIWP